MVAVSLLEDERIELLSQNSNSVVAATAELYAEDKEFLKAVSQSTGDTLAIRNRVSKLLEMLKTLEV